MHEEVITMVAEFAAGLGFTLLHLDYSPIKGPEGNIEYLLHSRKEAVASQEDQQQMVAALEISKVVQMSHREL